MYCGDETGSFVGEVASHTSRFGYGGDDSPKASFQSFMYRDGTIPITTSRLPPQSPSSSSPSLSSASNPNPTNAKEQDKDSEQAKFEDVLAIYNSHYDGSVYGTDSITDTNDASWQGVDPEFHMKNDGIIHNFDAWENVWHKAFDQLNVRHLGKHTSGTVQVKAQQRKRRRGLDGDDKVSSETISTSSENDSKDTKLMHPVLTVDSGYTYLTPPSSSSTNNNDMNHVGPKYKNAVLQKQRTTMMEIILESLSAPAMFVAPAPMLSSFAHGRQTSLIVDIGASGTRVTPVVDGLLLENAQRRNGCGGEWLNCVQYRALKEILEQDKTANGSATSTSSTGMSMDGFVHPRYALKYKYVNGTKKATVSYPPYTNVQSSIFHQLAMRDVMFEMKTGPHMNGVTIHRDEDWTVPFMTNEADKKSISDTDVQMDVDEDDDSQADEEEEEGDEESKAAKVYELPDGTQIDLDKNAFHRDFRRLPELLFSSETPFLSPASGLASSRQSGAHNTLSSLPIHELIKSSLTAVADADVRKELCGNIILTGATSLFPNMEQRLSLELSDIIPSMYKCKVLASRNTIERRYSAWIGGSVLSSLGSFQQLWLSHQEYQENGAVLASQRFP